MKNPTVSDITERKRLDDLGLTVFLMNLSLCCGGRL